MKLDNPFDAMHEAQKARIPQSIRDAAIDVTDTADLCWAGARAVFGPRAKPEQALAMLAMVMQRAEETRRSIRDERTE